MVSIAEVSEIVGHAGAWLTLALETIGAATIAAGAVQALRGIIRSRGDLRFSEIRFTLARYLALALEFQLAADILKTATEPEWSEIGQLAAIAAIRTALNYFLSREMKEAGAVVTDGA